MSANPVLRQQVLIAGDNCDHPRVQAERILLGAMLREVYTMPKIIGGLNLVALSNAANGLGCAFLEIVRQFNEYGNYTVTSVARALENSKVVFNPKEPATLIPERLGENLAYIASEETETDLAMALDWWNEQYQVWAQLQAYSTAQRFGNVQGLDMLQMRENVAKAEAALGLNWSPKRNEAPEDFLRWGLDKIEGKSPTSNMRCPIQSAHKFTEFFEPGYVTVISGDTSMGKSQLAYQLFSSFCDQGAKGIFNSGEMPEVDGYKRLLGIRHGINPKGNWHPKDYDKITAALQEVKNMPNSILKIFGIGEIEAACVAMKYNGGIDFLFIDLLKYVTMPMAKGVSREEMLSTITAAFITLAGRLKIHIFLVHHLNGDLGKRGGSYRPILDDLRDSKAIKQDVANVIFCYRPAYYGIKEDSTGKSLLIADEFGGILGDYAELIWAKNRNGILGTANVRWSPIRGYRDLEECTSSPSPSTAFPSSRVEPEDTPF